MPKLENDYQAELIKTIRSRLPGSFVIKNDSGYIQGIPDLIVLYGDRWAVLEVKKSAHEPYRPNQEYYLGMFHAMSWSATIYPENQEVVLLGLQQALQPRGSSRLPKRE